MFVQVIEEHGYFSAMLGLSLSYNQDVARMPGVADKLKFKGNGHNKFLESIQVYLNLDAPRYFWQQLDTYRCGITKQSESTMHTVLRAKLTQENFEDPIPPFYLEYLNELVEAKEFKQLKNDMPEGFLQRRIVSTNYRTLQTMKIQREAHKLEQWQYFLNVLKRDLTYPELIWEEEEKGNEDER